MRRLYVLGLGEACWERGTTAAGKPRRAHIPVLSYLLVTDAGRRVLIDTGMNRGHVADPDLTWRGTETADSLRPVMRVEDTVDFRLALLGLRSTDITDVVNTHLHFDHAGNNDAFIRATLHVQREQYEIALDNPDFPNQYWRLDELRYRLLDGPEDLGDGISVLPTPGHVPGHQSVLVRLERGRPMLLCGDAIYDAESLAADNWEGHSDPQRARVSSRAVLDLAKQTDAEVIFGHDPAQKRTLQLAPGWYE